MPKKGKPDKKNPAPAEPRSRTYSHPRSGKDPALTLVAADLARENGLPALAGAVTVAWNSRMRTAAGRAFTKECLIELNPRLQDLPEGQRESEMRNTFLHELAHLVALARAGRKRIQPHGPEWQRACYDLGIPGENRCHALDFKPRQIARKFAYTCPHCRVVIERVRRLGRRVACFQCCRRYARGQFDARYQLVESKLG